MLTTFARIDRFELIFSILLASLLIILAYKTTFGKNGYFNYQKELAKLQIMKEANREKVSENVKIATIVNDLKANYKAGRHSDIIEENARFQYNLHKPGEIIYRFSKEK